MRIFVTGGTGFVGRNFLAHPQACSNVVFAPSRSELDLSNQDLITAAFRDFKPDVVIHAAGRVGGIHANVANPVAFLVDNWDVGRNVLLASREARVPRLLNLGSSCMYPRDSIDPLTEEDILSGPLETTNEGYAIAKLSVARLGSYISKEDDYFAYKTAIPCNLFGLFDHFDPTNSHLVAAAIRKAEEARRRHLKSIVVWGNGTARREFMFAADLADFMWHALWHFDSMPFLLNVGTGVDHTIDEYYLAALKTVEYSATLIHDETKPSGMKRKLLDITKLSAFGWRAATTLQSGMALTYKHFMSEHWRDF